jgi:hypothetical protein
VPYNPEIFQFVVYAVSTVAIMQGNTPVQVQPFHDHVAALELWRKYEVSVLNETPTKIYFMHGHIVDFNQNSSVRERE